MEENGAKAKQRISRAITLSLSEALGMMEPIHRQGGGNEVPTSALESIVGNSPTSSTFQSKIAALKTYGLIETHGKNISLSPLGKAYATPVTPEEQKQNAVQAFRKVPLFENLLMRYSGNPLPEIDQFFYNLLYSTYGVPLEEAPKWMKRFVEGARLVGLLVSEGGHDVVRLPGSAGAPSPKPQGGAPKMDAEELQGQPEEIVSLKIFGGKTQINIPDKIDPKLLKETYFAADDALEMMRRKYKRLTGRDIDSSEEN